ncbi:hypothetical protein LSH36_110g04008 [Paralvinella palmiformis]|uniref:Fatty acyl-CoA reductase n=1 Tax=Paralvinella palmiformis TaxID=53620 RepID=A0AAD9JYG6_9ANNE|nr:hypothetical protein LSH36_110g04008 [Paralvinella palmiformis]
MADSIEGVREYYAGRSVFITGATGYLGKVFDRLKKEQSSALSKIVLITGNVSEPGLGINPDDVAKLTNEVSVIIHNAATIRFTEPLKEMLKLAKEMKNLEAFVHISTAYSNCDRKKIDEILYQQRLTPDQLISATSENVYVPIYKLRNLACNNPYTYTFTKAIGELLLQDEKGDIPAAIVRPSIIVSSYADPIPGWIDGLAGANGAFAVQGLGILRTMGGCYGNIGDLVPVDMTANCSIVAGWMVANQKPKDVYIVNMTSGQLKPITWGSNFEYWKEQEYKYPCKNVVRPPTSQLFAPNKWLKNLYQIIDHYIPGLVFDALARITGHAPRYCQTLKSFGKFVGLLEYFTTNEWHFTNANLRAMYAALTHNEKMVAIHVYLAIYTKYTLIESLGLCV